MYTNVLIGEILISIGEIGINRRFPNEKTPLKIKKR